MVVLRGVDESVSQDFFSNNARRVVTLNWDEISVWDLTSVLAKPRLSVGETGPEIRWYLGTLQSAPAVTGPWSDLPAASPMPLSPIGEKGFLRVKVEKIE